jgi:bifunctional UDP-N-acetylglucosamine pyrophosphorylase/glucosamine-1-phosphate N-acetyltransferase
MSQRNCAVILAAGEGKRMKRNRPKCLSPVLFKPMLQWVIDAARGAGIERICTVTGFESGQVEAYLAEHDPDVATVFQAERRGTGHAVMTAAGFLRSQAAGGNVLVLNGDAPFLNAATIQKAFAEHEKSGNAVTVISALLQDPTGYGRIVRAGGDGELRAIVEQKDASEAIRAVHEVNSGAFWFRTDDLLSILPQIRNANRQGEYYLTDAVSLLIAQGKAAGACVADSPKTVLGANDCLQLHELNVIARNDVLSSHMCNGTDIPCTDGVIIGPDVVIDRNCTILPCTILRGHTTVGDGCTLGPNIVLDDCTVAPGTVLNNARGNGSTVESYLRAGSAGDHCSRK